MECESRRPWGFNGKWASWEQQSGVGRSPKYQKDGLWGCSGGSWDSANLVPNSGPPGLPNAQLGQALHHQPSGRLPRGRAGSLTHGLGHLQILVEPLAQDLRHVVGCTSDPQQVQGRRRKSTLQVRVFQLLWATVVKKA